MKQDKDKEWVDYMFDAIKRKKDARDFINYNIKMGVYDPDQFDGWSDKQLIKFADYESDRADWMADQAFEAQEEAKAIEEEMRKED